MIGRNEAVGKRVLKIPIVARPVINEAISTEDGVSKTTIRCRGAVDFQVWMAGLRPNKCIWRQSKQQWVECSRSIKLTALI